MTDELSKNLHEVGIGPLSKILAVKRNDHPKIVLEVASYVITGET